MTEELRVPGRYGEWYARSRHEMSGGGVWLRGGEIGTIDAREYDTRDYRVLLARLSTYRDVAVSTSHLEVYALCAHLQGIFPDLAYLPPPRDGALMERDRVPWLLGTQTKRGPDGFDCIGFSLSVPQEMVNVVAMMTRSGIPLGSRERLKDPAVPLILCGGASAGAASAFMGDDSPVDGLFVGHDPRTIARLFTLCRDGRRAGLQKEQILASLSQIDGFVRPGRGHFPPPAPVDPGATVEPDPRSMPVSYDPQRFGTVTVPITFGCRWKCAFCFESWAHRPYASLPKEWVEERSRALKAWSGAHAAELFSFNYDMHEDFRDIVDGMLTRFAAVGLKSQRFDRVARDPDLLPLMHALGKTSITCGMEGISERLRAYLGKRLSESVIRSAFSRIAAAPVRQIKVFLIATGRENSDDIEEFERLLGRLRALVRSSSRKPRVIFSVTPFVHFPGTPLGIEPPAGREAMADALKAISSAVKRSGLQVRLAADAVEFGVTQQLVTPRRPESANAFLSAMIGAVSETRFVYYETLSADFAQALQARLQHECVDASADHRSSAIDYPSADTDTLVRAHQRSVSALLDRSAGGDYSDELVLDQRHVPVSHPDPAMVRRRVEASRLDRLPLTVAVNLYDRCAGLFRGYVAAALARAFMQGSPELVDGYRGPGGAFWAPGNGPTRVIGEEHISLAWTSSALARLEELWAREPAFVGAVRDEFGAWGRVVTLRPPPPARPVLRFLSSTPLDHEGFLSAHHLRYARVRDAGGTAYRFEFTPDSLRRKVISSYRARDAAEGEHEVELVPGERFDTEEFCGLAGGVGQGVSAGIRVVAEIL